MQTRPRGFETGDSGVHRGFLKNVAVKQNYLKKGISFDPPPPEDWHVMRNLVVTILRLFCYKTR